MAVPTHAELTDHLVRQIDIRLVDPLEILLDDPLDDLRGRIHRRAATLATALLDGDDTAALHTAIRVYSSLHPGDAPFDPPVEWWRTPLGQLVAVRFGHPAAAGVSLPVAGAMLGISRQGVHDLVRRGKLDRHPDGGVTATSIRDRLRTQPAPPTTRS
ncbi:hypothetical protein [Micromonospora sp. NBC_01813]|uniref:hypothetical protein n=1 Tax=Micromonospora sp. NBC_01813 TaxID=2975988 RepID=UPI002DDC595B|nr:hypothetical protein [Micromonospora sp. NBC_01813]WSA11594.1 hypothetical protein OG958_12865 [Micromonospora sp. NBC_01813]